MCVIPVNSTRVGHLNDFVYLSKLDTVMKIINEVIIIIIVIK